MRDVAPQDAWKAEVQRLEDEYGARYPKLPEGTGKVLEVAAGERLEWKPGSREAQPEVRIISRNKEREKGWSTLEDGPCSVGKDALVEWLWEWSALETERKALDEAQDAHWRTRPWTGGAR